MSRVFWAPIRSPPVNPPSPTSRIIQAMSEPHGTCDRQCRNRSLHFSLRAEKGNKKSLKQRKQILFHSWRTLFSLINKNNKTYFFYPYTLYESSPCEPLPYLFKVINVSEKTRLNILPKWFVFTCLLRKLRFYGNGIMRNYIRLQLSHVKPANYMSTNNIDIGISQITIITIYYDKQFL